MWVGIINNKGDTAKTLLSINQKNKQNTLLQPPLPFWCWVSLDNVYLHCRNLIYIMLTTWVLLVFLRAYSPINVFQDILTPNLREKPLGSMLWSSYTQKRSSSLKHLPHLVFHSEKHNGDLSPCPWRRHCDTLNVNNLLKASPVNPMISVLR